VLGLRGRRGIARGSRAREIPGLERGGHPREASSPASCGLPEEPGWGAAKKLEEQPIPATERQDGQRLRLHARL
jgi:hypothetical protein